MSWTITPQTKVPVDPQFGSVSLLLHGDGSNGSTTITDSSRTSKIATVIGDAQLSTAQSKFGGSSIVFDKVGDRITYASSNDFAVNDGDFTIEMWLYSRDVSAAGNRGIFQVSPAVGGLQAGYSNQISIYQGQNGVGSSVTGGISVWIDSPANVFGSPSATVVQFANQWQHIALSRAAGLCRLFVDGVLIASKSIPASITGSNLVIGGGYATSYLYDGYIDDFRFTKGVARYTSNFTPPTAPFPDI